MTIEYSNAITKQNHSGIAAAIVIVACLFFFIPTTLIVLGYYASQPTGTLISPIPQAIVGARRDSPTISTVTVAAPNEATGSTTVAPEINSNIIDKTASISATLQEIAVQDPDVQATSQIYLSPRPDDKSIYAVKSKTDGQFVISANQPSDVVRYIDYQIVNP